ncbi:MAG: hypothetical protein ACPLQP_01225 [Moorellaceae bacterium]
MEADTGECGGATGAASEERTREGAAQKGDRCPGKSERAKAREVVGERSAGINPGGQTFLDGNAG